jgi:hypothetical protein
MHDLVINNATLIDGLGNAARPGSLAVSGGRIAAVGDDVGAAANGSTPAASSSHPASSICTPTSTGSCCGIRSRRRPWASA